MRNPYSDLEVEILQSPIKPKNLILQKPTINHTTDKIAVNRKHEL
jgi:hypothetical protein